MAAPGFLFDFTAKCQFSECILMAYSKYNKFLQAEEPPAEPPPEEKRSRPTSKRSRSGK